jgi:ribosomal RNA-processing protein 17
MREERSAEFERALEEHRRQLKKLKEAEESGDEENTSSDIDDEDEWNGIAEPPPVDYEAEYIDEDKYTTVTVEEMDPSKEAFLQSDEDSSDERPAKPSAAEDAQPEKKPDKARKNSDTKPKKKKKKFRYESKEERKVTRMKERQSNHRKAKARKER